VALLLRSGAVGLGMETEGPFAALFRAVRPHLPGLLGRVALLYALAGAALGLVSSAWVTACGLPRLRGLSAWAVGGALGALWTWRLTVMRPALFDDLPFGQSLFRALAERGQPWHPAAVALLLGLACAAAALKRRPTPSRGALAVLAVAGASALAVALPSPPWQGRGEGGPLVVVIGVDAFRVDRLAANGERRGIAPKLDAFLQDATLFDRAYTPIAQTEPAWRSLLTARWPHRHGDRYPLTAASRWAPLPTFAARFGAAGYGTSFRTDCSRFHFEDGASGFEDREQPPRGAVNFLLEKLRFRGVGMFGAHGAGAWLLPEMVDNRALAGLHEPFGYADRLTADLVHRAAQGPLLYAFHATSAHFPGDPTWPYYRRFADADTALERRLRMVFAPVARGGSRPEGVTRRSSEALYDGLIAQADDQVGRVLDGLRRAGRYDEALVVLFSDHGESFHADAPDVQGATPVHGARLHDEENRILLAVKLPRSHPGPRVARTDALVRLVDVGPTLLELAGLPPLEGVEGESLAPLLRGEPAPPRLLYAETGFTHVAPDVFFPGHLSTAPRSFDAYRIRADGVVELSPEAHAAALADKDVGAFDGRGWLVRSPLADGGTAERCEGTCGPGLSAFLDAEVGAAVVGQGP
jgi:arylsulfatase A-like enzyme